MSEERKIPLDRLGRGITVNALARMRREMIREEREKEDVEEILLRLLEEREAER